MNVQRIKLIAISIIVAIAAAVLFMGKGTVVGEASSGGPPTGRTGAPGESTCTSCHSGGAGSGQMSIEAPTAYVPGQTYSIRVSHTTQDLSRRAWGFELTSLTSANAAAGTFANLTAVTRTRTGSGRNYVEQSGSGTFSGQSGGASWSFNWTAPATNVGPVTFYAAGLQADDDGGESGDQTYTRSFVSQPAQAIVIHHGFSDFDGDGRADVSVFRPSTGMWYIARSAGMSATQWGIATDQLCPADYDGDDKADIAVWRAGPPNQAAFYIFQSQTNTLRVEPFGQTGDDAIAVGDWDGDGKADPAVYRDAAFGSQSYFFYRGSLNNPAQATTFVPFGTIGDKPIPGDFDGDGKIDPAVFRPSTRAWIINQTSTGVVRFENWGLETDKFVPGDYDGDSKRDLAVFRNGVWYIRQSSNGAEVIRQWGLGTDTPVPADFDGDGKTDVAVYRNGTWWTMQSSSGTVVITNFGLASDRPVPSASVR